MITLFPDYLNEPSPIRKSVSIAVSQNIHQNLTFSEIPLIGEREPQIFPAWKSGK